jgi:hypothetical protein
MTLATSQFEQQVLPLFEQHRAPWLDRARAVARRLGQGGATVTIDMVRVECPPPDDVDPRVMGAVFTRKEWENRGYMKGFRSTSHGRPVAMFKLREAQS